MTTANPLLAGEIEYNTEYDGYKPGGAPEKWDFVREALNRVSPVKKSARDGWVKIPLVNKKEANRAGTAACSYAKRINAATQGWRIQTSVETTEYGANLRLRKIWVK